MIDFLFVFCFISPQVFVSIAPSAVAITSVRKWCLAEADLKILKGGGGRQFISSVLVYGKCPQRNIRPHWIRHRGLVISTEQLNLYFYVFTGHCRNAWLELAEPSIVRSAEPRSKTIVLTKYGQGIFPEFERWGGVMNKKVCNGFNH